MKTIKTGTLSAIMMALGLLVLAGFDRPGAHSVQVFLDNDMILEKYVDTRSVAPSLALDRARNYKELTIRYSECGRTVNDRRLALTDKSGRELKTWRFEGATAGFKDPMTCQVKDILEFVKPGSSEFGVRYSSNDFPEGIHILTLDVKGPAQASRE